MTTYQNKRRRNIVKETQHGMHAWIQFDPTLYPQTRTPNTWNFTYITHKSTTKILESLYPCTLTLHQNSTNQTHYPNNNNIIHPLHRTTSRNTRLQGLPVAVIITAGSSIVRRRGIPFISLRQPLFR